MGFYEQWIRGDSDSDPRDNMDTMDKKPPEGFGGSRKWAPLFALCLGRGRVDPLSRPSSA